jgi:predicted lipid carrier protein YhbT
MSHPESIPLLPPAVGLGLRPLPLAPLQLALSALVRSVARRHPGIFTRLGPYAEKRFLIEPTDLPFVVVLTPRPGDPGITVARAGDGLTGDARMAGPLAALVGMLHGEFDGDALFFSRDLTVDGDVEAVVALRNALDDAELDLIAEGAAILGPFANPAERIGRLVAAGAESVTGVSLSRPRSRR